MFQELFNSEENLFLLAQIVGFMAMSICVISMQFKSSRQIILSSVPSGLLWTTQYGLLGAPMGAIVNGVGVLKNLFITFVPQKYVPYLLGAYLLTMWSIGLYNLSVWYALLPLVGASTTSIALFIDRQNRGFYARAVIIGCSLWACYNITVGAYMGLACDTLTITSAIIGMARHENWEIGKCYKSFAPSIARALITFQGPRTYP